MPTLSSFDRPISAIYRVIPTILWLMAAAWLILITTNAHSESGSFHCDNQWGYLCATVDCVRPDVEINNRGTNAASVNINAPQAFLVQITRVEPRSKQIWPECTTTVNVEIEVLKIYRGHIAVISTIKQAQLRFDSADRVPLDLGRLTGIKLVLFELPGTDGLASIEFTLCCGPAFLRAAGTKHWEQSPAEAYSTFEPTAQDQKIFQALEAAFPPIWQRTTTGAP